MGYFSANPQDDSPRAVARDTAAGAAAGVAAGVVMILFAMIYTAGIGAGLWLPLQLIGATAVGLRALLGSPEAIALGALLHLVASALWGILFAWVAPPRLAAATAGWAGIVYGLLVLLFDTFLLVPWVDPALGPRVALMPGMWIVAHALYGGGQASMPLFRDWFARRQRLRSV